MTPKSLFDRENWEPMWDSDSGRWHPELHIGTVVYFMDDDYLYFGRIESIRRQDVSIQIVGSHSTNEYNPAYHGRGMLLIGSEQYAPDHNEVNRKWVDFYRFINRVVENCVNECVRDNFVCTTYQRPIDQLYSNTLVPLFWWLHSTRLQDNPKDGVLVPIAPESYDSVFTLMSWREYCHVLGSINALHDQEEVDALIEAIEDAVNPKPVAYEWNIINGDAIRKVYGEEHFGSCLYGNTAPTEFFVRNSDRVAMVTLRDNRGRLKGRALLWWCDEGEIFLDRIYPVDDNSFITDMFKELATNQGWYTRKKQSVSGSDYGPVKITSSEPLSVTLDNHNAHGYPFMDTFVYLDWQADSVKEQFIHPRITLRTDQPDEPFLCLRNLNGGMVLEGDDSDELARILNSQRLNFNYGKYVRQDSDDRLSAFIYAPERLYSVNEYEVTRPTFTLPFPTIEPQPLSDYLMQFALGTGENDEQTLQAQVQVADTEALEDLWADYDL